MKKVWVQVISIVLIILMAMSCITTENVEYNGRQILYTTMGSLSSGVGISMLIGGLVTDVSEFTAVGTLLIGTGLYVLIPMLIEIITEQTQQ